MLLYVLIVFSGSSLYLMDCLECKPRRAGVGLPVSLLCSLEDGAWRLVGA